MASLPEAERARAQKAEYLRGLGAHAVGVEPVAGTTNQASSADQTGSSERAAGSKTKRSKPASSGQRAKPRNTKTMKDEWNRAGQEFAGQEFAGQEFAVIAYFDKKPKKPLPKSLEIRSGTRRMRVPLALRLSPRFRSDQL